ncbi:hypothetical protein SANA_08370 [Gottschalkiaceae bacterium SANA]|nr:hypothetical protein SANA_08370 [Gottschalkiaceae bacterium SANA]
MKARGKQEFHIIISLVLFFLAFTYLESGAWIRGGISILAGGGFLMITIAEIKRKKSRK